MKCTDYGIWGDADLLVSMGLLEFVAMSDSGDETVALGNTVGGVVVLMGMELEPWEQRDWHVLRWAGILRSGDTQSVGES